MSAWCAFEFPALRRQRRGPLVFPGHLPTRIRHPPVLNEWFCLQMTSQMTAEEGYPALTSDLHTHIVIHMHKHKCPYTCAHSHLWLHTHECPAHTVVPPLWITQEPRLTSCKEGIRISQSQVDPEILNYDSKRRKEDQAGFCKAS